MAFDIIKTVAALGNTTVSPTTVIFSGGNKARHLIVLGVTQFGGGSISSVTDTQGNLYTQAASLDTGANGGLLSIWYAVPALGGTADNTITVAWTVSTRVLAFAGEYAGQNSSPLDTNNGQSAGGASLSYTLTNATSNELIVSINGRSGGGVNWSGLSGTDRSGVTNVLFEYNDILVAPSGSNTITATSSATGIGGLSVSFKSAKTGSDAITRAQNDLKGVTLATTDALDFANEVYQQVGLATFWDWLIVTGTTFGTVANQQDYANVPNNLRRLKAAWINDDSSTFTAMMPLAIRESLPKSNTRGLPNSISVENTNLRLFPVPVQTRTGTGQWAIFFEYWKRPKRLTATTDTFEFDDAFFEIFAAGFTARVAEFVRFENTGQWGGRHPATGRFTGTGLWGKFAELLNSEVLDEELQSGVSIWAPEDSLMRG